MKSNVCKIENGTKDLDAILNESERVAAYNGLTHKQTLQLRLLCEEVDGMLPSIIDDFDGELWIDYNDGVCKIYVSVEIKEITSAKKEEMIKVAKNKKNAAAKGIVGKIRSAIEDVFLDKELAEAYVISANAIHFSSGYGTDVVYPYYWSLEQYREVIGKDKPEEEWDELEKSVIASLADDVIVGVKGRHAHIEIIKKFA
jgi:hypothetical protein